MPACRVTTISQWVAATEMNDSSGSLRLRHVASTRVEPDERASRANSSTARLTATTTKRGRGTHRSGMSVFEKYGFPKGNSVSTHLVSAS